MRCTLTLLALAAGACGGAHAQQSDLDALALADRAPETMDSTGDWQVHVEGALEATRARDGSHGAPARRATLDARYDRRLAPGWRVVLANRLDLGSKPLSGEERVVNTLKEAYLSWQPAADRIMDLGRINARQGVATGYNPTDYFKTGALRARTAIDPDSIRKNRLGSVMLRGQALWNGGSLTAAYAPKIGQQRSTDPFSPDFGATNYAHRVLLTLSHALADGISPQWLLYGETHGAPQLGMNLTALVNDATTINVEWSGGRGAHGATLDEHYHNRLAAGVTHTTARKLSLTLELQYNGAAPGQAQWRALQAGDPARYALFRSQMQDAQELTTRRAMFVYATRQDAGIQHLDLTAMVRRNLDDRSALSWIEARYHWRKTDAALQFQYNRGQPLSDYGAITGRSRLQALVTYYF